MSPLDHVQSSTESLQRPRFGPLRQTPPAEVVDGLRGAASGTGWTVDRFGYEGGFPNGGIWRVSADRSSGTGPVTAWVKRTGAAYLGVNRVWRCRSAEDDPQWWGREAAFYESELATSGWLAGVRPARCYVIDDHDDCRDLWLEDVEIPAGLRVCERAAAGLAGWQVANLDVKLPWLSEDWIPTHVRRHELDNARTLAHPAWTTAIERGLDPVVRDVVELRLTDPEAIRERLQEFPQTLTHYDFHAHNVGTAEADVAVIDWAYVGWGPIGHDAGHLALDLDAGPDVSPSQLWHVMQSAYCDGLTAAGWPGDPSVVRQSMTVSNLLRLGWTIDHLLGAADQVPDGTFAAMSAKLGFLAELHHQLR